MVFKKLINRISILHACSAQMCSGLYNAEPIQLQMALFISIFKHSCDETKTSRGPKLNGHVCTRLSYIDV